MLEQHIGHVNYSVLNKYLHCSYHFILDTKRQYLKDNTHLWTWTARGPFERFVNWWQCAAVIQTEAVTYAK